MTETAEIQLTVTAESEEVMTDEAVDMDIHYSDGTIRGSDDLEWHCDRTGLVVKILFFGPGSKLLWTWRPEEPMVVVNGMHVLRMPARVVRSPS